MQILGPVFTPPSSQGARAIVIPTIPPSTGAHRYWRFYITANGGGATCSLAEIELRSVASGSDLTGSGTASASNSYTGWPPSQAVDNNTGTGWSAHPNNPNSSPQWWAYDFGSGVSHEIVEVQITPHSSFLSEAPTAFLFQSSDDGSVWTTFSVISGLTWPTATPQTLTITPTGVPAVYGVISSSSGQLLDVKAELPREYSEILLYVRILAMPPALGSRILILTETTHYTNPGGSGNRTASVTVTQSTNLLSGTLTFLIDGTYNSDGWFNGNAVAGAWLQFQLSSARVITGFKLYQSNENSHGIWKPQGSNDGSSWTDLGFDQTLGGITPSSEISFHNNVTAYSYYRLLGVSGNTSSSPYIREIEFKIDGGTVLTYGVASSAGTFRVARYATAYEGEPLTDFGDSLNSWLDAILFDFATPQMELGESLDFWSDLVSSTYGHEVPMGSDLNLWSDSNNLFNDLGFTDTLVMADAVSYTMFEIMLPLFLSVADSMIKTSGPQPTRFEMKDGVSYFMDAAESPLFISIDDLETFLADSIALSFVVFFNTVEGEAFDSLQYNWFDEVAFDLIINQSFTEDWMFQTDDVVILFETALGVGDSFSLSDSITNAAITEFFEIFDSMDTMQDAIGVFLLVHLTVAVEDFFGLADSGDSIVPLMGSANISYLRRYLNDAR